MAENPQNGQNGQPESGEKNNLVKIIVIAAVVVVVLATGIAFGVAKFVLSNTAQVPSKESSKEISNVAKLGASFEAGEFTTNVNSQEGMRFTKVKLVLEVSNEKVKAELENKKPKVEDTILSILRNKTFEELRAPDATDKLKKEVKERINTFLAEGRIENVFFTYFITQ